MTISTNEMTENGTQPEHDVGSEANQELAVRHSPKNSPLPVARGSLRFSVEEQVVVFATTLTELAIDRSAVRRLIAAGGVVRTLVEVSARRPPKDFTCFNRQYLEYPTELGREKHPVDRSFFETEAAAIATVLQNDEHTEDLMVASKVDVKVHTNGALTLTCKAKTGALSSPNSVDEIIVALRIQREKIQIALSKCLERFVYHWNTVFEDAKIEFDGPRSISVREQFEYLDVDINDTHDSEINIEQWLVNDEVDLLREVAGFSRMSHVYTRESFSRKFLDSFFSNDISNRENELWLIFQERFVRYYPEREKPEAAHLNMVVPLLIEQLLATKATYRQQISSLKQLAVDLPYSNARKRRKSGDWDLAASQELRTLLAEESLRLNRLQFPSDLAYYANTEHTYKLIRKLEETFQIDLLADALKAEQNKLSSTIDAVSERAYHGQNMRLQIKMMWLTIFAAIIASALSIIQLLGS